MPRMELSEREAEIIRKHREETRFFRAGAHAAINRVRELTVGREDITWHELIAEIERLKNEF